MLFDNRTTSTILAALRYWQGVDSSFDTITPELRDVLTNGETVEPLSDKEIDSLCERINMAPETPDVTVLAALKIAEESFENFAGVGKDDGTLAVIREAIAKIEHTASSASAPSLVALVKRAVDDWPQFDVKPSADGVIDGDAADVNGGDLVDWFANWREAARAALIAVSEPAPPTFGELLHEAAHVFADGFDETMSGPDSIDAHDLADWFAGWRQKIKAALANPPATPIVAIVLDGGLVQAVVSNRPDLLPESVMVIDYDTEGSDDKDLCNVPQGDGTFTPAYVHSQDVKRAAIDLPALADAASWEFANPRA